MKYLCVGDYVISKSDGDRHYIPASRLPQLYGVNPNDCHFIRHDEESVYWRSHHMPYDHPNGRPIVLRPRYDGNYKLEAS